MRLFDQNIWGNMKPDQCIANRNDLIRDLVASYDPDVVAFQECNPKTSRAPECDIAKKLLFAYDEAAPDCADRNFTPLFYHRERVEYLDGGWQLFEGKNDKNSKSFTWALLREKKTGQCVTVLSTHFWWKWESEEDDLQRKANAAQLRDACDALFAKYGMPILVTGDLNSGVGAHQGEGAYREMCALGMRDVRFLAEHTTNTSTHHPYPILNESGVYTDGAMPTIKNLDYVFFYKKPPARMCRFEVVTSQNALDSSDHCPLLFDFELI